MLEESLTALAAAGGAAVVQAAGTDAWTGLSSRIAGLFSRGDRTREQVELARLNRSAAELAQSDDADGIELARFRQATVWQARIEDLLEELGTEERETAAAELQELVDGGGRNESASVGGDGTAVGRDMSILADRNSFAAGFAHIDGGVHLGNPTQPGSDRP